MLDLGAVGTVGGGFFGDPGAPGDRIPAVFPGILDQFFEHDAALAIGLERLPRIVAFGRVTDDPAASTGTLAGRLDERLAAQFDHALAQLRQAVDTAGMHWPVIFRGRGGRRFELAENLFVQPRPSLGR
ncbi:hypothetical protein D3C76_1388000 [compost metagenome]